VTTDILRTASFLKLNPGTLELNTIKVATIICKFSLVFVQLEHRFLHQGYHQLSAAVAASCSDASWCTRVWFQMLYPLPVLPSPEQDLWKEIGNEE
jgi:hypothetical protein